jgi:hypothetical protein
MRGKQKDAKGAKMGKKRLPRWRGLSGFGVCTLFI